MPSGIVYGVEPNLNAAEFRRVLVASGLDARRPAEDPDRLDRMPRGAGLIVTARAYTPERQLLGVARSRARALAGACLMPCENRSGRR